MHIIKMNIVGKISSHVRKLLEAICCCGTAPDSGHRALGNCKFKTDKCTLCGMPHRQHENQESVMPCRLAHCKYYDCIQMGYSVCEDPQQCRAIGMVCNGYQCLEAGESVCPRPDLVCMAIGML